jgi:hypothetical protein
VQVAHLVAGVRMEACNRQRIAQAADRVLVNPKDKGKKTSVQETRHDRAPVTGCARSDR